MHRPFPHLPRQLRGLLVALAAVALSAGAVMAARPESAPPAAAAPGLARAAQAAGKPVPVVVEAPAAPDENADEDADPTTDEETTDGDAEAAGERPQNHGWFVSQAAQAETPDGFANHGAYVSSIAKGDQGKAAKPAKPAAAAAGQTKAAAAKAAAKAKKTQHAGGSH